MKSFIEAMTEKDSYTNNGAITNSTSHDFCVDLFFLAGACRSCEEKQIENVICKAYEQNRLTTLKIIFWAGDIRQGAGERRFFKIALSWLCKNHPEDIQKNLVLIPEFSRWDVIFELALTNDILFSFIIANLVDKESKGHGLLCKWLPRKVFATDTKTQTKTVRNKTVTSKVKTKRLLYGGIANKIRKHLNLSAKQYRQLLVAGTKVVEQQMCSKQWNKINYSQVPSVAMNKYNKAWYRNDETRFEQYLEQVKKGTAKINASAIFPNDIIKNCFAGYGLKDELLNDAQITQWNNLPNWMETPNSILPVCDVSGSMYGLPITISVALGLYISERNIGPFKDAFFTFSETPTLNVLKGDINSRLQQICDADWGNSTNLVKVFSKILDCGVKAHLSEEQMPKTLLVISDMEFNACADLTNYEMIQKTYKSYGYKMPQIVFWNVNGRPGNVPITYNTQGTALISGSSPSIIKSVLCNDINPQKVMYNTIDSLRYSCVS